MTKICYFSKKFNISSLYYQSVKFDFSKPYTVGGQNLSSCPYRTVFRFFYRAVFYREPAVTVPFFSITVRSVKRTEPLIVTVRFLEFVRDPYRTNFGATWFVVLQQNLFGVELGRFVLSLRVGNFFFAIKILKASCRLGGVRFKIGAVRFAVPPFGAVRGL